MTKSPEQEKIHNLFKEHLRSIGVVSISLKTKGFKKYYTMAFDNGDKDAELKIKELSKLI